MYLSFFSDTELGEVPVEVTDRWAAELNKDKLWRELSKKLGFLKKEVMGNLKPITKCIRRRPLTCVMRHESCYNIEHF